jgi:hypothetical protein
MDKYELFNKSINLLDRVIKEIHFIPAQSPREYFIYHHAQNILTLSRDILFLDQNSRVNSNYIIIRTVLESLFNLVAATKNPSFAKEKMAAEPNDAKKQIEKGIRDVGDFDGKKVKLVSRLTGFYQQLRNWFSITRHPEWNTCKVAQEAGLLSLYRTDYFMFSTNTHANIVGIVEQKNQTERQRIIHITIFILFAAVESIIHVMGSSESYKKELTELRNELNPMLKQDVFIKS